MELPYVLAYGILYFWILC